MLPDNFVAVPLEEDVEVFSDYLLQLIATQNLEQLWRVLKFLDRYYLLPLAVCASAMPFFEIYERARCLYKIVGWFHYLRMPFVEVGFKSRGKNAVAVLFILPSGLVPSLAATFCMKFYYAWKENVLLRLLE